MGWIRRGDDTRAMLLRRQVGERGGVMGRGGGEIEEGEGESGGEEI